MSLAAMEPFANGRVVSAAAGRALWALPGGSRIESQAQAAAARADGLTSENAI
jgi:hypothetical protein